MLWQATWQDSILESRLHPGLSFPRKACPRLDRGRESIPRDPYQPRIPGFLPPIGACPRPDAGIEGRLCAGRTESAQGLAAKQASCLPEKLVTPESRRGHCSCFHLNLADERRTYRLEFRRQAAEDRVNAELQTGHSAGAPIIKLECEEYSFEEMSYELRTGLDVGTSFYENVCQGGDVCSESS